METDKYVSHLEKISSYYWDRTQGNSAFMKREKMFINECLNLIDLTIFPHASVEYINKMRAQIMSALNSGRSEHLEQYRNDFHARVFQPDQKLRSIQVETYQLICMLFPASYSEGGDSIVECFSESLYAEFHIDDDMIANLLYKYFNDVIDQD